MNSRAGVLERNKYIAEDVYSDIENPYASSYATGNFSDAEISVQSIQQKLGAVQPLDREAESDNPDIRPSKDTMSLNFHRNYAQADSKTATVAAVSTRTKVAVVSYVAVVLALIIAISFCSVAVAGAFGSAASLEGEYAVQAAELAELENLINSENYEELAKRAEDLGFIDANSATSHTYELLETRPAQNFNVETNWFDQLCDWLSGLFGG